jgi:hypothetical protein
VRKVHFLMCRNMTAIGFSLWVGTWNMKLGTWTFDPQAWTWSSEHELLAPKTEHGTWEHELLTPHSEHGTWEHDLLAPKTEHGTLEHGTWYMRDEGVVSCLRTFLFILALQSG